MNIRKAINKNPLYAWMLVVILLIQSYAVLMHAEIAPKKQKATEARQSFTQEIEANRQRLQKILKDKPDIAADFGYIFLFALLLFVLGLIFLTNFIFAKLKGDEPIPKTFQETEVLWSWKDAVRIAVIFIFFNHIVYVYESLLLKLLNMPSFDKRASMIVDTMFMDFFVLLLIIRFVSVKYKQRLTALGIAFNNMARNIGIALFAYLAFLPVLTVLFLFIIYVAKLLNYTPGQEPIYELIFKENRPYLLIIISWMVMFIGPIIEEIFFRGFLYSALKKGASAATAILISAFVFSLLHTNVLGFLPIMGLGIFLAYLREKTGSLIPSIVVHILHNAILAGLMFFVRQTLSLG